MTYPKMIDCVSGFAEFSRLFNIISVAVVERTKTLLHPSVHFGVPEQVISDTRLQFSCEVF